MGEAKRRRAMRAAGDGPVIPPLVLAGPLGPITRLALPPLGGRLAPAMAQRLLAIAEGERRRCREALLAAGAARPGATLLESLAAIGTDTVRAYEIELAQARAEPDFAAGLAQVECRKGCAFCCHLNVVVTVLEAVRIVAEMAASRIADRRAAIAETARAVHGLGPGARQARRRPCPLLVDAGCSAYEARPLACRSLLSTSAALCEADFLAPPDSGQALRTPSLDLPRLLAAGHISGQMAALRDLGLAGHLVELTTTLDRLESDPGALLRWLGREDVFPPPGG
jgi:hypothetical protein